MDIRLLKKGIRVRGEYRSVWYSGASTEVGNATIYFRDYGVPAGWHTALAELGEIVDESDIRTDYFQKPLIRVKPGSKYFETVQKLSGVV